MPESSYPMLPVEEALATVLRYAEPLPLEKASLPSLLHRVLGMDVRAQGPLPPFPASIKDGYAVVASDGPGDYTIVGEVVAGRMPSFAVISGTVAYITTGAPMPDGADAVVMVEATEDVLGDGPRRVRVKTQVQPGDDVRQVGVDIADGDLVLAAGERLGPAEIGLLATVGMVEALVFQQPRVAILSTGDELTEPSVPLKPGQIRDSNRHTLAAAVLEMGGVPVDLGIVRDQQTALAEAVAQGLDKADILLTSGGVSMGELDLIKPLLEHAGVVHFGRIRMKPGKPLTFATVQADGRQKLIFGLPGNPVSSLVTFYLMAAPAIRRLAGWPSPDLPRIQATLAQSLPLDPERPEYHRATLRWDASLNDGLGGYLATSTGSQASSRLLSMRTANALLELPQADGMLMAGAEVAALLIGDISPT